MKEKGSQNVSTVILEVEEAMQEQLGSTTTTIIRSHRQLWRLVASES